MAAFDPYWKWLGIPPAEQPPNLYRLLGIGLFESDPDVISNAADRQMVHVRSFQRGKHSEFSQRILNELAAARVCLLDPARRAAYDEQLRQWMGRAAAPRAPAAPPPVAPPPGPPPLGSPPPPVVPVPPPEPRVAWLGSRRLGSLRSARRDQSGRYLVTAGLGVVLIVAVGVLLWAVGGGLSGRSNRNGNGGAQAKKLDRLDVEPTPPKPKSVPPNGPRPPRPAPRDPSKGVEDLPPIEPGDSASKPEPTAKPDPAPPKPADNRLPLPDSEAQKQAEADITGAAFKKEFEAAGRPEPKLQRAAKQELARKLLDRGRQPQATPATTYVLLRSARDLAVALSDVELAVEAADELGKRFAVDAMAAKAAALGSIAEANIPTEQRKLLAAKAAAALETPWPPTTSQPPSNWSAPCATTREPLSRP